MDDSSSTQRTTQKDSSGAFCSARTRLVALKKYVTKIIALRALLVGSLIIAAVLCSTLSYYILRKNEKLMFESKYNSISESALVSVVDTFDQMNLGLQEMASTISHIYPNSTAWPNVAWSGFYPAATLLGKMAQLDNIIFSPIVLPDQLPSYRTFLANYYTNEPYIPKPVDFPPNLSLGDVWALNLQTLVPYSDTTGYTHLSPNRILTPTAQATFSDYLGSYILAYNLHSDSRFTRTIDAVIECARTTNATAAATICGAVSDAVPSPVVTNISYIPEVVDYQALLAHPIFPAANTSHLAGFVQGAMSWKALLKKVVPTYVTGLDCVIKTNTQVFTYSISNGVPWLRGLGDFHQHQYSSYGRSQVLHNARVTNNDATYEVRFYPRSEFEQEYVTTLPIWAVVLLLLVFLICSVVFFFYDWLMQRESGRKQAILDTKRRFVRFISHEIRTPLNTVRLGLNLLESELASALLRVTSAKPTDLPALMLSLIQNWTQLTTDVLSNSESAVEVLDDLLNYDKIEMGNLRLDFSQFSIWKLVRETVSVMQIQAHHKHITLGLCADPLLHTVNAQDGAPVGSMVVGDMSRMGQVLKNLISNALKFTPAGGDVNITVELLPGGMPEDISASVKDQAAKLFALSPRAGSVQISVTDSGAGLSEQQLRLICTEGVQFNANELQAGQGSGLGLFISKGIVEQHGGRLTVTSEGLGKGVTFTIELPLFEGRLDSKPEISFVRSFGLPATAPEVMLRKEPTFNSDSTSRQASSHMQRLLVVDDSIFNRKMLIRLLTSKGFVCEQAEDGQQAIDVYSAMQTRGESVYAILMDFEMPVMNGPTATKKLRELGCTCLIVGVTGNVLPEEQAFFKRSGADAVLSKPFAVDKFEELLLPQPRNGAGWESADNSGGALLALTSKAKALSPTFRARRNSKIHADENV